MLDLQRIRDDTEAVAEGLRKRSADISLDRVLELDRLRRSGLAQVESLKQQRNQASKQIGSIIKEGGDATELRKEMKAVGARITELGGVLDDVQVKLRNLLSEIPNVPEASVPEGSSAADNALVRTWGERRSFDFEPQAHWDLGPKLGILDFERAAKVAGARFAVYIGDGAALERALVTFMLDLHTREHGYLEVIPPYLVNDNALFGTGQLPKFEEDLFKVQPGDYHLVPTAEVPVTNLHADEILDGDNLPLAYTAFTPCFRSEAGSYGKDVRGLIRQHQFNKVELVRFSHPEDSYDQLELLTGQAEEVLRRLGLHYRVVNLCAGDLGFSAAKTYDLEVWLPAQGVFREISSCSNFEEFQARRAKIRFRAAKGEKPRFVHTLNGSALAVGRTVIAILENFQREDGCVDIPAVLRPYMGGKERIEHRR